MINCFSFNLLASNLGNKFPPEQFDLLFLNFTTISILKENERKYSKAIGPLDVRNKLAMVKKLQDIATGAIINDFMDVDEKLLCDTFTAFGVIVTNPKQSLLGSILSNMLLVLGSAFFIGGISHSNKQQVFNKANAEMNSGLLLMAVMGLMFPAVLHVTHTELHYGKSELALSRFSSCVMLVAYAAYLFFQLKSQRNLYGTINEVTKNLKDIQGPTLAIVLERLKHSGAFQGHRVGHLLFLSGLPEARFERRAIRLTGCGLCQYGNANPDFTGAPFLTIRPSAYLESIVTIPN
ncbi:hypothetical protein HYC85_012598 [Camellia sinensis]|uniref:Sodium/calcium exchanger membrane region domain-containing protein n=1 Tax=Camellia sinensis TaxID=4442 RepID=A0A7J7HDA0_CAMSI|nr:hypothetical protein HYC85_012598 [Camellia sinensis]